MMCGAQCDEVLVVMHFDEEREVTETECGIVNTTTCNQETVVRPEQLSVTDCGVAVEQRCLAVMEPRVEEECKMTVQRMCIPSQEERCHITEQSECQQLTGAECVQDSYLGREATVCETVVVEDCPAPAPAPVTKIDEYGAPAAPALDPAPCTPVTKQQCRRVPGMFCAGSPGLACDNVAREVTTQVTVDTCLDMPMRVCRNVTHWDTREECHDAEVTRCGPIPRTVDTPREEEVCRHTSQQQCRDVTRTEVISVPREVTKQKCVPITVTQCRDVEVEVPERRCVNEDRPVCTVATHNKCFNVKKEVSILTL